MEPFRPLDAVALPLPQSNMDTDQVIPARFLPKPRSGGCGQFLFHDLRFAADGSERPEFRLNQPAYRAARIAVAADNFGCGSSRENAVWALFDYGFRAVIAPSFGDIFAINCLKNGVLPVTLDAALVSPVLEALIASPGTRIAVDLAAQTVTLPGGRAVAFEIDPFAKHCLLEGLDELDFTLGQIDKIETYERSRERAVS